MGIRSKVSVCGDAAMYDKIAADFICNRFDLTGDKPFVLLKWQRGDEEYYVQAAFEENTAELGVWLAPITREKLKDICRFIFRTYKRVTTVTYRFGTVPYGKYAATNHFRIDLPASVEALLAGMTPKSRYNLRRSRRLLEEAGGAVSFEEYAAFDAPAPIAEEYIRLKKLSHDFEFDAAPEEYLRTHGVTDIYVMRRGDELLSVLLSCEQCRIVYLENLTYNDAYKQYSPGQLLYEHYLERLIEKKRGSLFLMGGDYEYKRRYGAVEDTVYFCTVYKRFSDRWKSIYKKKLKRRFKTLKHKLKLTLKKALGR